mgnify:CR=1 FL=1
MANGRWTQRGRRIIKQDFRKLEEKVIATEAEEKSALKKGQQVHLKTTYLEPLGLGTYAVQGGEGVIVAVDQDIKGLHYTVKLHRNGKTRVVRRESLVIHRKGKSK